jgi:hypothetical protein
MDMVYECGKIKIVAAAAYDPMYGLPGVGLKATQLKCTGNCFYLRYQTHWRK